MEKHMKKLSVSALALVAALVAAPLAAHADTTPGWYVGGGAGISFGIDGDIYSNTGKHQFTAQDHNVAFQGNGGYAYGNGFRLEGEYYHNQTNIVGMEGGYKGAGGHITNNALFANVLYDIQTGTRFTPYVGGGIGPDFINVKSVGSNGVGFLKGDTLDMGYQGIAGVAMPLDPNWTVTADYRYIASFDPKVDHTGTGQGRMDNATNNVMVGLRYTFAEPQPVAAAPMMPMRSTAAPMVAPRAGARPMVAGSPQNYMVFFDFNKSMLTPEAKRIIASAATEYKRDGYAEISVTGHTDTVGSDSYNKKLSERRAMAVEAELKKLGVGVGHIKEEGVGKEGLMVPTANGVREAQNRRAEIVLSK
jgi:OOP family OmpA-OmpF porin